MKTSVRFIALIIAITAPLVTPTTRASVSDTLLITENSSTSLTAILNGTASLPVTLDAPDFWFIILPGVGGTNGGQAWFEPGTNGTMINIVSPIFPDQLFVTSDFQSCACGIENNTPDNMHFTLNGAQLIVTFNDLSDGAVPDTGSTFDLLALALAALFGASRFRALRLT